MAGRYLAATLLLAVCDVSFAAKNDWAEGTAGRADGATREYYNRAGLLEWTHRMGDWRDAANIPQGERAYATTTVIDNDTPRFVEWDVTSLVREWIAGRHQNQGLFLRCAQVGVWMNVYHGGTRPSPYDQHVFIDNVVIANKYIGPWPAASASGAERDSP